MEELVDLLHSAKARKQRKAEQVSRLAQSAMEQPQ
jgi:hypothetical protein